MEKDDLRKLARNAAQEPFRINMTGGESFEVRHRDFITVSDYHAAVVVKENEKESVHLAAIMNISTIDKLPVVAGSSGA